ncbi:MAG TPA: DUF3800 domain-containing protein [Bacteroidia bacterium]|nr:DUF3800 domain-containing protein [Bacteroidia bacterium]
MSKTFNFYCDESCHLGHDKSNYMLISYISSAFNQVKMHSEHIRKIKLKHYYKGELKWSTLSKSQYPFYNELIDYFFATDLQFRAIVINKSQINNEVKGQSEDDFYNKMYYQLIHKKISQENNYNLYLDIKDTHSFEKTKELKEYLNRNFIAVKNCQNIKSYESELMQLTDVIMGAISYHLRGLNKVIAKNRIIEKIQQHSQHPLNHSTSLNKDKFNLFFIDLK